MNDLTYILSGPIYSPLPALIQILWSCFVIEHLSGGFVSRLLRWLLVSGAASAGGGAQRTYYEWSRIPMRNESAIAGSFFFIPHLDRAAILLALTRIGIPGFLAVDIDKRDAGLSRNYQEGYQVMTASTHEPETERKPVTITVLVNERSVTFTERHTTGAEIKATAISQGIHIQPDFALFEVKGPGKLKPVGDDEKVNLNPNAEFRAIAPDDNS